MNKFIVLEGPLPDSYKTEFERYLFNEARHRHSQISDDWSTFSLVNNESSRIVAQIHFYTSNGIASSPHNAPFGSVEFMDGLAPEFLLFFLSEIEMKLTEKGIKKIVIKDAPYQYRPQQSALLSVALMNQGFIPIRQELNVAVEVDETRWEEKISAAERRRLKRCRKESLEFHEMKKNKLKEVYRFIENCRRERGMSLSLSLKEIEETVNYCPDDFLFFGVLKKNELMAASISVKLNDRILYNFYPAHIKSADSLSPAVALLEGIYSHCYDHGFRLLDLGTSSIDNQINFSLLNFKIHVGGEMSIKLTFVKELT